MQTAPGIEVEEYAPRSESARLSPELRTALEGMVAEREQAAYLRGWEDGRQGGALAPLFWTVIGAALGFAARWLITP